MEQGICAVVGCLPLSAGISAQAQLCYDAEAINVRLLPVKENLLEAAASRTDDGREITYRIDVAFLQRFFPEFHCSEFFGKLYFE